MLFRSFILIWSAALIGCAGQPRIFTDDLPGRNDQRVAFEMVYIPGDRSMGIEPFYIGQTEVTWAMFLYWANSEDLNLGIPADVDKYAGFVKDDLRPSLVEQEFINRGRGLADNPNRPAIGLSRLNARAYCKWVSKQTGKTYRLPTDAEWMYVLHRAGGLPSNQAALLDQAVLADNAPTDAEHGETLPQAVASKSPNRVGLFDFLGNAGEWIEPAEGQRWLRGGHFRLSADELTDDWFAEEDLQIWMKNWPSFPYSRFWYLDHYYQGIRLVCEVDSIEE